LINCVKCSRKDLITSLHIDIVSNTISSVSDTYLCSEISDSMLTGSILSSYIFPYLLLSGMRLNEIKRFLSE